MDQKAADWERDEGKIRFADAADVRRMNVQAQELLGNIGKVVLGKRQVARDCLIALFAGEHVLIEDVPGVGKTLLAKALARSVEGAFRRIQFTPDLLPSDILGSSVFNSSRNQFEFVAGPIFSHFVLADEINRAPPRTQSALLEAMSDRQVSIDGVTHSLPDPFMVLATQNPFEYEGTYLLPESQMDRFLFRLSMGYPERDCELQILDDHREGEPVDEVQSVCDASWLREAKQLVRRVFVEPSIAGYLLDVVQATRHSTFFRVGASTRGALLWYRATQASAFLDGRAYVVPDDAKQLAIKVLAHRVKAAGNQGMVNRPELESMMSEVVGSVPVPN